MPGSSLPKIGVVGLGYVGLPLTVAFAEVGCEVMAVDLDAHKVDAIRAGESYIEDISDERLRAAGPRICPATSYEPLGVVDAIVVCVPTPLTDNREPDLAPLLGSCQALSRVVRRGQLVVLESTTYPGTTRERVAPLLEESGLTVGEDFHLAFQSRARGSWPHRFHAAHHPQGARWLDRRVR